MGKTRDLFKKIRDTKGAFHAKMGSIKDRNVMDLTEAKDYTNTLCQNHLHPFRKSHTYWPLPWPFWKFLRAIWESVSKVMFLNKTLNRLNSRLLRGFLVFWQIHRVPSQQRSFYPHSGSTLVHQPVSPLNSPFGALCKFHFTGRLIQSLVTGDWLNL